jgi:hypothetical protein
VASTPKLLCTLIQIRRTSFAKYPHSSTRTSCTHLHFVSALHPFFELQSGFLSNYSVGDIPVLQLVLSKFAIAVESRPPVKSSNTSRQRTADEAIIDRSVVFLTRTDGLHLLLYSQGFKMSPIDITFDHSLSIFAARATFLNSNNVK